MNRREFFGAPLAALRSERAIDERTDQVDAGVVREMLDRGMRALTGEKDT